MLTIGMIGSDNFHALAFSKLANLDKSAGGSGLEVRVNAIWGEQAERTQLVAQQARIPVIVQKPQELLSQCDAVMIVLRHGDAHYGAALPFIQAGMPTWIDKPFTINLAQAQQLVAQAKKNKAILAGGSTCKYCPDVLAAKSRFNELTSKRLVNSASFNFPAELDSPYGGLYFYAAHAAEILTTIFGNDVKSVKADVTAGNLIAVFKYDNFAVSVNFAQASEFYCALYTAQKTELFPIDISQIYREGFIKFINAIQKKDSPEPYESLLLPVRILNALEKAVRTGKQTFLTQE